MSSATETRPPSAPLPRRPPLFSLSTEPCTCLSPVVIFGYLYTVEEQPSAVILSAPRPALFRSARPAIQSTAAVITPTVVDTSARAPRDQVRRAFFTFAACIRRVFGRSRKSACCTFIVPRTVRAHQREIRLERRCVALGSVCATRAFRALGSAGRNWLRGGSRPLILAGRRLSSSSSSQALHHRGVLSSVVC